ncbi:MAG: Ig domain-containing protein [Bacteroidales bacterium]|nr:Ig domain-containing protein [Bacteroidales bacterium]
MKKICFALFMACIITGAVSCKKGEEKVPLLSITFKKVPSTMVEGETFQIEVSYNPAEAYNKNVEWTSSAPAVATVSNGLVSALAPGEVTIKAISEDGGRQAACTITVTEAPVAVTGVSLKDGSLELKLGETYTLQAEVTPQNATNPEVKWSSNSPTVASVTSEGVVTALSEGSATITVTTDDGGFSASCKIKVLDGTHVTGIELSKSSISIPEGSTETLTAVITPETATNKTVLWSSDNESVASVNEGVVSGNSTGSATITAETQDGGFKASCTVTVTEDTRYANLSKNGTANCYVVPAAGEYAFVANVIGNGDEGIIDGSVFHTFSSAISPASVEIIWERNSNHSTTSGLISELKLSGNRVTFKAGAGKGNVLVAARNALGRIIWSWHLWLTDTPEDVEWVTYQGQHIHMMDRNMGATTVEYDFASAPSNALRGFLYQWGRKDPLVNDPSQLKVAEGTITLANAVEHPAEYLNATGAGTNKAYKWAENVPYQAWGNTAVDDLESKAIGKKTIYDPCPPGYRVPQYNAFSGLTVSGYKTAWDQGMETNGKVNHDAVYIQNNWWTWGFNFYTARTNSAPASFLPATGRLDYSGPASSTASWSLGLNACMYYWTCYKQTGELDNTAATLTLVNDDSFANNKQEVDPYALHSSVLTACAVRCQKIE